MSASLDRAGQALHESISAWPWSALSDAARSYYKDQARIALMAVIDSSEVHAPMQEAVCAAGEKIPAGLPEAWRAGIIAITGTEK